CLLDHDDRLWGIDHGLTLHHQGKLRTVIWDFIGEPVPPHLIVDVERLLGKLERANPSLAELDVLLDKKERRALCQRVEWVLATRTFPDPPPWRPVPWPAL
ncbi:MAG: SCO1664 family protein, partial [Dehalococcoidia bacterium]